ncbi:MAG: hypothetical protein A2293_03260 [Elusimicrobia bacterium RIFOXYB2_FULL_49_7]|nr:MAG: hypothetical protein A2293_03260 [Elusimicrobia bacterium RIFOXYB2_FULL_49_7]
MNDTLVKSDSLYYLEGRYQLTAKLFSDNRCIDTSLSFVIDMTPPDIRFLGLPEKPVVVCTDPFLKKSNTTLNGKPLPLQGTRLHHLGDYRLAASAEDSAGNRADKEAYFTLLPADAPLTLIVTSHADENFTNTFYDTLCGWVNSNAINLTINGDSVRSLSLYRDSTRFSYPVRLISGSNYFEIKAASRITTQSASKSIAIHSDTLSPTVTILSPLPGSRHASDINLFSIPITGEVKCNGLLTSVQLKSGWMNMAADFQKIGDNRYSFSGSIGVRGENSRYPVSVEAINQYGNRTLSTVIIAIGQKPRLLPPSPPSNSGTNAPLITISGKIIEPNLRTLSIQNVPVSFTQAGDTACYAGEILLPTASANNIFITAEDSIGFRDSLNLIINRDIAPPTAAISFPTDNYTTQESLLTITGTLDDPYAFVWANNDTADYPSGPLFQIQNFRLTEGNNTLTIQCQDTVGNIGNTITLQVTRLSSNIIHVNNSYQGTEDGTAGRPFTTLTKGLNASTQGTLLLIHGGTYHESGSFKAGMIIQGVDKPVWLDGGSSGYTASGVLYLDHINMMGQGDWLLSASSGNRFSATVCTLATTGSGGWALSGYARVDINNVHIRTRLSGNGLSVSACDSLFLSNFRIDSSAQSGIHVATAPFVRIDHCLFQHCGLAGLTLTQCGSQVEFSTFSENLSAIALSQGTLLLKNSILVNNTAYAINRSNVPALTLQYNDFFGNNLGLSQNPSDLNDLSNIFSSPLFINKTDFLLQDASPAKNSGENGCEMGLHGFPKLSRKAASTLLISPQSDCFVNNTVRLIASQNRLESNYQLPTILYQGKWQPVLPVPDSLPDQVWGLLKTAPYPAGKYTLRLGRYTLPIRIGLPEWVREIPMKDTTIQTFKPQCHSGNLTYSLKKHTLFCHDQYDNLLFSFDGFGKAPYRFDSPKGIAVADSFLFVADEGNQRIMVYKIIPGNPAKEKALSADINSPLLSIKDCHFIPSPFRPEKEKGYIRYRLSRPAEVTITLFDLAGFKVREWHFDPGERGGKMGVNEIAWNGRNGDSRMVVDGAYVFRVSAKTGSERAKSLVKMMKR